MGTITVQGWNNGKTNLHHEKPCAWQKPNHSTQPRPLHVQTCTQLHDKHTALTDRASELAYMSIYI